MADPTPPKLPKKAPKGLVDFVDCKAQAVTIAKGKIDWLDLDENAPEPDLSIDPGDKPGSAKLNIGIFGFTVASIPAASANP